MRPGLARGRLRPIYPRSVLDNQLRTEHSRIGTPIWRLLGGRRPSPADGLTRRVMAVYISACYCVVQRRLLPPLPSRGVDRRPVG